MRLNKAAGCKPSRLNSVFQLKSVYMSGVSYSRFIAQYDSVQCYYNSTQIYAGKYISWFKFT